MQKSFFNYRQSNLTLLTFSQFPYMRDGERVMQHRECKKRIIKCTNEQFDSESCNPKKKFTINYFTANFQGSFNQQYIAAFCDLSLKNFHEVLLNIYFAALLQMPTKTEKGIATSDSGLLCLRCCWC